MTSNPIDTLLSAGTDQSASTPAPTPAPQLNPIDDVLQAKPAPNPIDATLSATPSDGGDWLGKVYNGVKNVGYNVFVRPGAAIAKEGADVYHGDWKGLQRDIRGNLESQLLPFMSTEDAEKHIEQTPDEGIVSGKGIAKGSWSALNMPLAGTIHRKGAGTIESTAEDWITGQLNPLNIGLAVATMGSSAVESGLVKAGMTAKKAASLVRYVKLGANLGFLAKFGYDVKTNSIPMVERDWKDYRSAKNDSDREKAWTKLEHDGTELTLGSLAAGLASHGVTSDLAEIRTNSPKGKAMANQDYANAVFEYQAENQVGSGQASQLHREGLKQVPDAGRREAISNNIEANADLGQLDKWKQQLEARPETKKSAQGYEDAKQLADPETNLRDRLRSILDAWKARLRSKNLLAPDGGRPNYLPHKYDFEDIDPTTGEPINWTGAAGERDFLKKRTFDSYAEAEQKGLKPKTKDAVKLVADYVERANNMIARDNLADSLASGKAAEGSPMAAPKPFWANGPVDSEVTPIELQQLKAAGKFDDLLKKGRIYEVPAPGKAPNYAYRSRDVGEAGVPSQSHSQATLSEEEAKGYTQSRARITGNPQELVKVNLDQLRPEEYSRMPGPNGNDWVKFNRDLAEREVEPHTPLSGRRVIPRVEPQFKWNVQDYVDSGLRANRPAGEPQGATPGPGSIVKPGQEPQANQQMARVPVYVHPEIVEHLRGMLDTSAPKSALLRGALKVSSAAKSVLLSLSPFHWATILNRSLESGMSAGEIFRPAEVDYFNLTDNQQAAINDGVVAANTRPGHTGYLEEGNVAGHQSFASKIPIVGKFNHLIEQKLFGSHGWITGLKFELYDNLKTELQKSQPSLAPEQAGRIAAAQVNNKFGGLNYTAMGRSASTQNALRAMLLAPDFLESTGRSVLDIAGPNRATLAKAFVAFNAAHYLYARLLNKLTNDDWHPESGFKVQSKDGKKEYGIRTTMGDFLHFIGDPMGFMENRVNPTLVRAPVEGVLGVDMHGKKISNDQRVYDIARQVTPIPTQGIFPTQQITQPNAIDDVLKGFGIGAAKRLSPAETMAVQRASAKNQGEPAEGDQLEKTQKKFKLEDDLRTAVFAKDANGIKAGTRAVIEAAKGADPAINYKQAQDMINDAHVYPDRLRGTVRHLSLEDALDVYNVAGIEEKKNLRTVINQKVMAWYKQAEIGKKTSKQLAEIRPRISKFFQDKP